jgi:hypothetical protein
MVGSDTLVYDVPASEQTVHQAIDAVRFWIGNRNKDIENGNKNLRVRIDSVWMANRSRLEQQQRETDSLLQTLQIPLKIQTPRRSRLK